MNGVVRLLFRIAREAAWGRAYYRAGTGRPLALARRIRNKQIFRLFGPWLRK